LSTGEPASKAHHYLCTRLQGSKIRLPENCHYLPSLLSRVYGSSSLSLNVEPELGFVLFDRHEGQAHDRG